MANESTNNLEDIVVPDLFTQYVLDETIENSELIDSGLVENNPKLDQLVSGGGTVITMPKWNELKGKSQVFTMNRDMETRKITARKELGTVLSRGNGWSTHDLAGAIAGSSPRQAIVQELGKWWKNDEQDIVGAILNGVFASAGMADHILDITEKINKNISAKSVLAAKQLLGDKAKKLKIMYMHSAVHTALQQQQLITTVPEAEGKIGFETYLGYRIIVDDSAPVEIGTGSTPSRFTTYLLAPGSIQRGTGIPADFVATEIERRESSATTILWNRQMKCLHPKGMSWTGAANIADETPNNEELATGTNWAVAVDNLKKIGMVAIVHNIDETL